ncbi:MAG: hypothetical protein Q9191_002505 [Dirinaria sp. TL-2023a]
MSSLGNLSSLAIIIQSHVSQIEGYMQKNDIDQASFDVDSPVNIFNSLHFIYRFRVAHHLRLDEEASYEELGCRCSVDPTELRRFLRLAIAYRVFQEPRRDVVVHSAMSRCLVELPAFYDWVGLVCEDMLPASIYSVNAMTKWPGSSDPAHTGFSLSNGIENSYFNELERNPLRATRFANGMAMNTLAPAIDPSFLVDHVPWADDPSIKSIVDVGGSHGAIGVAFLDRFPHIEKFVVQDLPNATNSGPSPGRMAGRLEFQEYDFFTQQRNGEADVYILRSVLHNWPDDKAIHILKNQVLVMKPRSRVILNEICLPELGVLTRYQEQFLRFVSAIQRSQESPQLTPHLCDRGFDLAMKHVFNGKERDAEEWAALIERADSRLKIQKIVSPAGSLLSIIEVVFA